MIYTASLSLLAKKAYPDRAMQSSINRIMALLNEDPEVSQMEVVVLGPKDVIGPRAAKLNKALEHAHPGVCIVYLYTKSAEENNVDVENRIQVKKLNANSFKEAVDSCIKEHVISTGRATVSSKDFQSPDGDMIENFFNEEEEAATPDYVKTDKLTHENTFVDPDMIDQTANAEVTPTPDTPVMSTYDPSGIDVPVPPSLDEKNLAFNTDEQLQQATANIPAPAMSLEESLANVKGVEQWDEFISAMQRDSVVKRLIQENSEYSGLIKMIDTLDYEIECVFLDTALTADMKFDKIKELGLKRAACMASTNSITTDKVINIISKITLSAKRTVEQQMTEYNAAISTIVANKKAITDTSHIAQAMEQRVEIQNKLLMLSRRIVDLYKTMGTLVDDEIMSLDAKLPSSNEYINQFVKPVGTKIFTPVNSADLANKLMKALQNNRLTASSLEASVNELIELMFNLFEKDREIIAYQERALALLRANKIEDIIIADTVLKHCLRLWTGADGTGRSATAITWCGILSRRQNSLLLDLTGKAKFKEYGITPMLLEDFMNSRPEQRFLCVEASEVPTPEQLQDIIDELKTRLNYYPCINVIVDPSDLSGLNQLSVDALTTYYVCDCTSKSMSTMKEVIANHTYGNIARRLVLIDPPISPLSIIDSLEVDPTLFATVTLPSIPEVRACALRHDRPYEYENIVKIFEEAFR